MSDRLLLAYVFTTLVIGVACLGAVLVVARRRDAGAARTFLFFYAALTTLVFTRLISVLLGALPDPPSPTTVQAFEYMEGLLGRYWLMFAVVYFVHRVYGVDDRRRDLALLVLTVIAFVAQHITEYLLPDVWDDAGDVAEDVLFWLVLVYALWTATVHRNDRGIYRPLARRFLALLWIGGLGIPYDLFLSEGTGWRFYPLWYCILSIVLTATFVRQRLPDGSEIPIDWGLSEREREVAALLRRGLSNPDIARKLVISENTVKTHVRAIYDKSGVRTRASLIAALADGPTAESDPTEGA